MSNRVLLSLAIMISYGYSLQPVSAQIQIDGSTATQVNGNTISPTGSGTVSNGNLFHSFNQFNVTQTGVIFNTGNSNVNGANINNIINRVTGDTPSSILGTIQSRQSFPNANVYLINPNGIVFGQNAKLDIGGSFHANTGTGLTFSNNQTLSVDKNSTVFPSGDPQKILFTINQPAGIINQGNLQVDAGKSITFTGGTIVQTGSLTAPNGNVAITSVLGNRQVELRSPDAVLGLTVESSGLSPDWNGKITDLPNLAALLTSKVPTANQVVIKPDGSLVLVEAVTSPDILVSNGTSVVSGKIDVSSPLFQGGNVGIFGNQVSLVNAKIDASGLTGGGTVLVGGNLQGKGIQPNAVRTFVDSSSMINVSAILNGNGGKAIIWADQLSRFFGNIFSNGGSVSGDGGFVEVSGKEYLIYRGNVDTSAANGKSGTLLLDPTNITVINGPGSFTSLTDVDNVLDPDNPPNTIDVSLINSASANVSLQATNNIKFDAPVNMINPNIGLTANAGNKIDINAPIETQNGAIIFTAGNNINFNNASITTNGGALIFTATNNNILGNNGNISTSNNGNAGIVNLTALSGEITFGKIEAKSQFGSGGAVTIIADKEIRSTDSPSIATDKIISTGTAGNILLRSNSQSIDIGTVTATAPSSSIGGEIKLEAKKSINAGALISKSGQIGGNIILNSTTQNIVFTYADSSGGFQGGDFTATSSSGKIRATSKNTESGACFGSSICTAGGSGGLLNISHDGLKPFIIGDSSKNGTKGTITTGTFTLTPFKIIPKGVGTFTLGNIAISPSSGGGAELLGEALEPPNNKNNKNDQNNLNNQNSNLWKLSNEVEQKLLGISNVLKKQVDLTLQEQDLAKTFDLIERAYASELEIFLGNSLKVKPIDIANAQDILGDIAKRTGSAAVLIYPIVLSDRLEIMVIPPKDKGKPFSISNRDVTQQILNDVLLEFRSDLFDSSSNNYLANAQKLYNWIMRPIDAELQARKIDTVVFVMDSLLRVIPASTLHDGKQFLVERYAIANIPSLRLTRLEDRDRKNSRILAMGLTESVSGFSALPSVEVEIRTINSKLLAGTSLLNKEFTVSNLQAQRLQNDYGIVHLATHGKFVSDNANDSFIQFWDSQLTLERIPRLRFDSPVVEMLTLSACETSVGNNLGISGLAVDSGARSVLASLWAISDAGTAPLMINFYKLFPEAKTKALALQQAQRSLIDGSLRIENNKIIGIQGIPPISLNNNVGKLDLRHPFFWAPFLLIGSWL
ncbi:CHAT domain-containing protein [Pseudanabaena mucicola]|uniref:CHAT domain-containing protein n=1 Tax=Pseudanabaena mucicola TaxID=71190 RepID=UPI00257579B7|nr:CHAT domain-containing protein [Pseudanabaena mucicola]